MCLRRPMIAAISFVAVALLSITPAFCQLGTGKKSSFFREAGLLEQMKKSSPTTYEQMVALKKTDPEIYWSRLLAYKTELDSLDSFKRNNPQAYEKLTSLARELASEQHKPVSREEEKKILSEISASSPGYHGKLVALKKDDPAKYQQQLQYYRQQKKSLERLKNNNPALYERISSLGKLNQGELEIKEQFKQGRISKDEARKRLFALWKPQYENNYSRQALELSYIRLKERIEDYRDLKLHSDFPKDIIAKEIKRLEISLVKLEAALSKGAEALVKDRLNEAIEEKLKSFQQSL